MNGIHSIQGRVGGLIALAGLLCLFSACTTTAVVVTAPASPPPQLEGDDLSELIAQLRADLTRHSTRQSEKTPILATDAKSRKERDQQFAARARSLFTPLHGAGLQMPVVGIQPRDLSNSWHFSRDGGRRKHKGIDIFASKGTAVVAVADGIVSYIGEQPKGGLCLWLTTEAGTSFYYAHLDRWAPGLYDGMDVASGVLLGYVGNTGNARTTPPHLHFAVNDNDEMVNPYPILTKARTVSRARVTQNVGSALGTR